MSVMQDKEYLVFGGSNFYPAGGFEDYLGKHIDLDKIKSFFEFQDAEWAHIVDAETLKLIIKGKGPDYLEKMVNKNLKWEWEDVK